MKIRRSEKNCLDEMQEQKMLHIEKRCFWGLYFMLAASVVIQLAAGSSKRDLVGELIPFFAISIYMIRECLRNGIWDRRLKADGKTNLMVSGVASAVVLGIMTAFCFSHNYKAYIKSAEAAAGFILIPVVLTFICTLAALSIFTNIYRKRVEKMETQEEEND